MKDGFVALKAQVEEVYGCLGIICADVGAFQNSASVFSGMEACVDSNEEDDPCVALATAPPPATTSPTPPATPPPTAAGGTSAAPSTAASTTVAPTDAPPVKDPSTSYHFA